MQRSAIQRAALPFLPMLGAILAKKAVAGYALFNAVHAYGVPQLYRQIARATRAWGAGAKREREEDFLRLVKGAVRAPTSAVDFVERSYLARVLAEVASNPGLRRELNARVPPVIWEAAQDALRRTPAGKAVDAAYGVLEKLRPKR